MTCETPEATIQAFIDCVRSRDLEGLLALYEPDALFIPQPGARVAGRSALREAFAELFSIEPELHVRIAELHQTPELALLHNDWSCVGSAPDGSAVERSGRSTVVMRKHPQGGFRIALDRL